MVLATSLYKPSRSHTLFHEQSMEDESGGLELSLGLSYGGSCTKHRDESGDAGNTKPKEEKPICTADSFQGFLQAKFSTEDHNSIITHGNVANMDGDSSKNLAGMRLWAPSFSNNKRKMCFEEMNKHEKPDSHKLSCVSKTEDGAIAEHEDAPESDVDDSMPRLVSRAGSFNGGASFVARTAGILGAPLAGVAQALPVPMSEDPTVTKSANSRGQFPIIFGYSSSQLPVMDKDRFFGFASRIPPFRSPDAGEHDFKKAEHDKEGSGDAAEEKDGFERSNGGSCSCSSPDTLAIKPGIYAEVKFGGSGSCPNLPWVSTTGPGPDGRTVSGVAYRCSESQVKIVCACHGSHLMPDEFVRHAEEEHIGPHVNAGLSSFPAASAALTPASAQS